MTHPLRIGLKLSPQVHPIATHRAVWRIADDARFDGLWGFDHLQALGDDPTQPVFEGWSMLAAMAEATTRVRIGLMVAGSLYRHPGMHAKIGATIDHLSNGRLEFGIGAGWNEPEFAQLGMDFPPLGERLGRFGEAVRVIKRLWTQERANFKGKHFTLTDAIAEPKPLQKPYPPIWIGGSGPQRTLKVVARHGDVWNSNAGEMDKTIALSKVLDEHCRTVGRDPNAVRRSVQFRLTTVDESLKVAESYLKAGFTEQIVMLTGPDPVKLGELAARELLPRLRALG
ncbi:MAG: TIGR03560 family F420-dependent LLM class oxidoreductase [Chloroflexota bacterium]|nr:TIGR03560 family F420-dependent LLM class oxidoreductase [Chloroflexota bacterium]